MFFDYLSFLFLYFDRHGLNATVNGLHSFCLLVSIFLQSRINKNLNLFLPKNMWWVDLFNLRWLLFYRLVLRSAELRGDRPLNVLELELLKPSG